MYPSKNWILIPQNYHLNGPNWEKMSTISISHVIWQITWSDSSPGWNLSYIPHRFFVERDSVQLFWSCTKWTSQNYKFFTWRKITIFITHSVYHYDKSPDKSICQALSESTVENSLNDWHLVCCDLQWIFTF